MDDFARRINPRVCMVHGLWMKGLEMTLLERRLHRMGLFTTRFSYASRTADISENAERLALFLERRMMKDCSFVCHSYGGLVVCRYLEGFEHSRPARIVFMGSPLNGSTLARRLGRLRIARFLAGKSLSALQTGCPTGVSGHHCAMIAGSLNIGLGMFLLRGPSDGMVTVEDTRAHWLEEHVVIRCSHLALLFSRRAAGICGRFLKKGT